MPGSYSARLTANGETQTVKFEVRADPRLRGVTTADMQERFALASKVRDKLSAANAAVIKIRKTRAQVGDRAKGDAELTALGDTVAHEMTGVEEDVYQVRSRSGQDPLNFPIKTNNRIAALLRSIETGEGRPTAGAYKVYDELSADLSKEMKALDDITKGPLARFNALLAKKNMQKIIM